MSKKPQVVGWYDQLIQQKQVKRPLGKNCLMAFASGGLLCAVAQAAQYLLAHNTSLADKEAGSVVMMCVIMLAALLTGLGVYDKLGQQAGAGLAVPITGFANSVVAACMEHRSEGFVLGSGCNSFKLAGAVVVFGIASAGAVTLIALILGRV